jgi:hypothetical protein
MFPPNASADDAVPANPPLRWWKGNLHTHSLWSDGNDFPEMIAEWYRTHGYHFLALSDHNVLSQGVKWIKVADIEKRSGAKDALPKYLARFGEHWVETRMRREPVGAKPNGGKTSGDKPNGDKPSVNTLEVRLKPLDEFRSLVEERGRFLMIPSEEISDKVNKLPLHLNATNLGELIQPLGGKTIREAIENNLRAVEEQAKKSGRPALVHLNHPNFHWAVTAEDLAAAISERFFEVYNGHTSVNVTGDAYHAGSEEIWDVVNTIRVAHLNAPPLMAVATDDSHHYHAGGKDRTGRGWVMVRCRHLTPQALIRAMKQGDFYASSGVTLAEVRYDAESRTLQLDIEPDADATFTTRFIGTPKDFDPASHPRKDAKGADMATTRKYSDQIGQTFATATGTKPKYRLTGKELYVRAIVTSSRPHENPSYKGQHRQAWTQPVGWQPTATKP